MAELLARFVSAFRRGIEGELAAMHASAKAFEIPLTRGEDLGTLRYSFERVGIPIVEWVDGTPLAVPLEEVGAYRRHARRSRV